MIIDGSNMITDSLWVLLFGMIGIFFVMLVIAGVLLILHRISKKKDTEQSE